MTTKQEDFLNRALALLLRRHGIATDYEQRAGRKRMDIVATVDGLRIVLEAEKGVQKKAQAIKDADARLRQGLTVAVFAVCYPQDGTEETLPQAELTWTLRVKPGEPSEQWSTGDAAMLARAVQQAPDSLSGADKAAQRLSDALDAGLDSSASMTTAALPRLLTYPPTSPAPERKAIPAAATVSPLSGACWLSPPLCSFTTDCRDTCRYCSPRNTRESGPLLPPPHARSRTRQSAPFRRLGAEYLPWTTVPSSRPDLPRW